jgi:hypothetical protein
VNPVLKLEEKEAKKTQNTQICKIHDKDMISNEMFKYVIKAIIASSPAVVGLGILVAAYIN